MAFANVYSLMIVGLTIAVWPYNCIF